jgi:L-asparaginase
VTIRIIITGGTFDKHYDEIRGNLTFKDTHLPEILKIARCTVPIEVELNQLIDSLDMHAANRLQVL